MTSEHLLQGNFRVTNLNDANISKSIPLDGSNDEETGSIYYEQETQAVPGKRKYYWFLLI